MAMAAGYYAGGDSLMAGMLRFGDAVVRARGLSTGGVVRWILAIPEKG